MESRRRASARWWLTDGVERVDGRVGDGDERDAVGAHLHGDPDRPRRGHGRSLARSLGSRCGKKTAAEGGARRRGKRRARCASVLKLGGGSFAGAMAEGGWGGVEMKKGGGESFHGATTPRPACDG